jgi:hypothetical protein
MSRELAVCGTLASYRRGCRCDDCRAANTARVRKHARAKGIQPVKLAPCGTNAAKNRHRRNGETCETCVPVRRETHPCGTWQSRRRHKRNNETCGVCATTARTVPSTPRTTKPRELKPCGTIAAAKRHFAHGEPVCEPCRRAVNEYDTQNRRARGIPERLTTEDLVTEARFLLNAGEGEARILNALGYTGRPHSLRTRLGKAGHHQLANQILNPWDLAA